MADSENRRVLIVDDNESIHADFQKIIGAGAQTTAAVEQAAAALFDDAPPHPGLHRAFELDSAYQGPEAFRLVERSISQGRPYALAFVDVRMPPGWNGVETVRRLWTIDDELQIVICTAYSDYSWAEMVEVMGETDRL